MLLKARKYWNKHKSQENCQEKAQKMTKHQETAQDQTFSYAVMAETIEKICQHSAQLPDLAIETTGDTSIDWFLNTQRLNPPKLDHTRLSLFVSGHRVQTDYKIVVEGGSALTSYIEAIDADLRVFELSDNESGTLSEREAVLAMTYGMMNVEEGLHALVLHGVMNEGETFPIPEFKTVDEAFSYIEMHGTDRLAALIGSILAARMGNIPVFLSGELALISVRILGNIDPILTTHCLYAGLVKCREKEILGSLEVMIIDADSEPVIASAAITMIQQWQTLFYQS